MLASGKAHIANEFIEKPNLEKASQIYNCGDYFWNAGIFVFPVARFLNEIAETLPEMYVNVKQSHDDATINHNEIHLGRDDYLKVNANSIDYAFLEQAKDVAMVQADFAWNDLGTWRSVWDSQPKDQSGNAISGNVITFNTKDSLVESTGKKLIATVDVEGISVIETSDAILIANNNSSQNIKQLYAALKNQNHSLPENASNDLHEPWGSSNTLVSNDNLKINKITIKPNNKLDLSPTNHRSEHWIITKGIAKLYLGTQIQHLNANEHLIVKPDARYEVHNDNSEDLELLQVLNY